MFESKCGGVTPFSNAGVRDEDADDGSALPVDGVRRTALYRDTSLLCNLFACYLATCNWRSLTEP